MAEPEISDDPPGWHDPLTPEQIAEVEAAVQPFLDGLKEQRGIFDFEVVADRQNPGHFDIIDHGAMRTQPLSLPRVPRTEPPEPYVATLAAQGIFDLGDGMGLLQVCCPPWRPRGAVMARARYPHRHHHQRWHRHLRKVASMASNNPNLFQMQNTLIDEIRRAWNHNDPYILMGGQRGGKNVLVSSLVCDEADVLFVSITREQANQSAEPLDALRSLPPVETMGERTLQELLLKQGAGLIDRLQPNTVVVLDEFFWLIQGYGLLRSILPHTRRVLALGSWNGEAVPHDLPAPVRRVPTWEMNPGLPFDSPFMQRKRAEDPIKFWRDFGCGPVPEDSKP